MSRMLGHLSNTDLSVAVAKQLNMLHSVGSRFEGSYRVRLKIRVAVIFFIGVQILTIDQMILIEN